MKVCSAFRGELDWSCEMLNEFVLHVHISGDDFYESGVIQPRSKERLFSGGELVWSKESTGAALGNVLLAVSDNL